MVIPNIEIIFISQRFETLEIKMISTFGITIVLHVILLAWVEILII